MKMDVNAELDEQARDLRYRIRAERDAEFTFCKDDSECMLGEKDSSDSELHVYDPIVANQRLDLSEGEIDPHLIQDGYDSPGALTGNEKFGTSDKKLANRIPMSESPGLVHSKRNRRNQRRILDSSLTKAEEKSSSNTTLPNRASEPHSEDECEDGNTSVDWSLMAEDLHSPTNDQKEQKRQQISSQNQEYKQMSEGELTLHRKRVNLNGILYSIGEVAKRSLEDESEEKSIGEISLRRRSKTEQKDIDELKTSAGSSLSNNFTQDETTQIAEPKLPESLSITPSESSTSTSFEDLSPTHPFTSLMARYAAQRQMFKKQIKKHSNTKKKLQKKVAEQKVPDGSILKREGELLLSKDPNFVSALTISDSSTEEESEVEIVYRRKIPSRKQGDYSVEAQQCDEEKLAGIVKEQPFQSFSAALRNSETKIQPTNERNCAKSSKL